MLVGESESRPCVSVRSTPPAPRPCDAVGDITVPLPLIRRPRVASSSAAISASLFCELSACLASVSSSAAARLCAAASACSAAASLPCSVFTSTRIVAFFCVSVATCAADSCSRSSAARRSSRAAHRCASSSPSSWHTSSVITASAAVYSAISACCSRTSERCAVDDARRIAGPPPLPSPSPPTSCRSDELLFGEKPSFSDHSSSQAPIIAVWAEFAARSSRIWTPRADDRPRRTSEADLGERERSSRRRPIRKRCLRRTAEQQPTANFAQMSDAASIPPARLRARRRAASASSSPPSTPSRSRSGARRRRRIPSTSTSPTSARSSRTIRPAPSTSS